MPRRPTNDEHDLGFRSRQVISLGVRGSAFAPILLGVGLVAGACSASAPTSQSPPSGPVTAATSTPAPTAAGKTPAASPTITPTRSTTALHQATVVDGDTINKRGQSIRIIGVDTPERGECGYAEATALTRSLTAGGVALVKSPTTDNRDRYDRLLRFVETANGQDVGARLIRAGLANARYDSRDGYDTHKFEAKYHRLDAATAHKCPNLDSSNSGAKAPESNAFTGGTGKCDPNYGGTCVPRSSSDLDCADISGPVAVKGTDIHGFDGDGDGFGCDSN
jgi:endonuclease YncB( thermonuclease family)